MKKGFKIIIYSFLILIILVVCYVVLIWKGIFPNPFLDTKDLICKLENVSEYNGADVILTFRFDKNAIFEGYSEEYIYKYETEELAVEIYESLKRNQELSVTLNGNLVKLTHYYNTEEGKGYYGKNKKQIKEIYIDDYNYNCK